MLRSSIASDRWCYLAAAIGKDVWLSEYSSQLAPQYCDRNLTCSLASQLFVAPPMAIVMRAALPGLSLAVVANRPEDGSSDINKTMYCTNLVAAKPDKKKLCCSISKSRLWMSSISHCLQHPSNGRLRKSIVMKGVLVEPTLAEENLFESREGIATTEDKVLNEEDKVDYNWETEWYPLYLTKEIPRDAPLALSVFDRSLVLFYDGDGTLNCLEDRCPHRLAKLSEGQIIDGNIECLYHGWQFRGDGTCAKLPQLLPGARIPKQACARSYAIKESQGVVWVWMADKSGADPTKVPWFEHFAKEGFGDYSSIHELPYDYSILLENLVDPAHIPISHDRTDPTAKREDAQALEFEVTKRTGRGFAGVWNNIGTPERKYLLSFEAPCTINNIVHVKNPKDGSENYFQAALLCRPAGQGKSMAITRFGVTNMYKKTPLLKLIPPWIMHYTACSVLEEDMGFLSSQNEVLSRENVPTKDLYLNIRSQDTWVLELRKWMDKVGHGLPYYWGHRTTSSAPQSALEENAPAGLVASLSASLPSKGAVGSMFARDPTNRYYRHFVHCKSCRNAFRNFQKGREVALAVAALSAGLALAVFYRSSFWRVLFVTFALLSLAVSWACFRATAELTRTRFRPHRTVL